MKNIPEIDYRLLFESLPGLYLVLLPDSDFTIAEASDAYMEATMTRRNEMVGKGLFEVFPDNPDDPGADGVSNLRFSLEYVIKNRVTHTMAVQKYDIRRQDGSFEVRYWSPQNKPVLDMNGQVTLIVHRVEDVTEYVRLHEVQEQKEQASDALRLRVGQMETEIYNRSKEINQKNEELMEANSNLESFTYSVSHDLRSPLRAIGGYASILEEEYTKVLDDEARRLLEKVKDNARRMGNLIDELLEFSKLGKKEIQRGGIDMKNLAENVVSELEKILGQKTLVKIDDLEPVRADSSMLRQVMLNLIGNAIKYSSKSESPLVHISSESRDGMLVYSIRDNGVGFDMAYVDKLFGVFQRLHTTDEFEGTGVGLAIVKRIINKHGGSVWAQAEIGKGATFYFSLPQE